LGGLGRCSAGRGGGGELREAAYSGLPMAMTTARKLATLRQVVDEADEAAASSDQTEDWWRRAIAALRSTMGGAHPSVAAAEKARFSPVMMWAGMSQQLYDNARKAGVKSVTALLKGAILEVEATTEEETMPSSRAGPFGPGIFLVHGHDSAMKLEVADFIERITGRRPVILHEQADQGRTIIEKFEDHASEAGFAIILLTADDEGGVRGTGRLNPRARQNVVLEFGFFIGKLGRSRVVALYEDGVELPSDLQGVLYKKLSGNWQMELTEELSAAGISVELR